MQRLDALCFPGKPAAGIRSFRSCRIEYAEAGAGALGTLARSKGGTLRARGLGAGTLPSSAEAALALTPLTELLKSESNARVSEVRFAHISLPLCSSSLELTGGTELVAEDC